MASMNSIRVLAAATAILNCGAYSEEIDARRRHGDTRPVTGTGQLYITPNPKNIPTSLKQLIDMSDVVIQGNVSSTLPSREVGIRSFETDALIKIDAVIKGPSDLRTVVVAQRGGAKDGLVIAPAQYALLQPSEKYLLFLQEDSRRNLPEVTNAKRYTVTGIWSGLFLLQDGRMTIKTNQPDHLRKSFEGKTAEELVAEIRAALGKP